MIEKKRYFRYMYSYPHKSAYYSIEKEIVREAISSIYGQEITLYIHVPFCSGKCGYCNLFSVSPASEHEMCVYTEAVCKQMKQYSEMLKGRKIKIKHVVIGGGTPFIFDIKKFETIFDAAEKHFDFDISKCGFDIETSPKETTKEKLSYLKSRGMQRISIGVQSFKDEETKKLLRQHNSLLTDRALKYIKNINPVCLNIDLIYGIQSQTVDSFKYSLNKAVSYEPDEIFLYPLYIREKTPLFNKMEIDDTKQHLMYLEGVNTLKSHKYIQTSMRRFVKNKPLNENSCGFEQILSIGCGGRSYISNVHFCEAYETGAELSRKILDLYVKKTDFTEGVKGYVLDCEEQKRRFVIKNLGYYRGISKSEFREVFNDDIMKCYEDLWSDLKAGGLIRIDDEYILLTEAGMAESDSILALWISDEVNRRMENA